MAFIALREKGYNVKNIIVVDIDGTIADISHRVHHLNNKPIDWDAFYSECDKDRPIVNVIEIIRKLMEIYVIIFATGRSEDERAITSAWLLKNVPFLQTFTLLMRKSGDHRSDTVVKPESLSEYGLNPENVAFILEDRNKVVNKWRELGYTCLQVADGDF